MRPLSAVEVPSATIARDVIGGNTAYGIDVEAGVDGVGITENYIGIGADGATPVANHTAGVYLNGGTTVNVFNNLIAESQDAILITTSTSVNVENNTIGADAFGMPLPVDYGVEVRTGSNTIHTGAIGDAQIAAISLQADGNVVRSSTSWATSGPSSLPPPSTRSTRTRSPATCRASTPPARDERT